MIIIKPDGLRFALTWYLQRLFMLPMVWLVFRVFNRIEVEGLENLEGFEGESVLLAPNHTTAWDGWVGTSWALSSRKRYVERDRYMAVLAAPENIPSPFLRWLVSSLGGIPVDREQGVEQFALQDIVRIINDGETKVTLTVYPEGTRTKTGKLRRRGRPGLGWVQRQTNAAVIPIYHVGGPQMPCFGKKMKIRIGAPMRFDHYQHLANDVMTWRAITEEVMDELRIMEAEELGIEPTANMPRSLRRAARRAAKRQPTWV